MWTLGNFQVPPAFVLKFSSHLPTHFPNSMLAAPTVQLYAMNGSKSNNATIEMTVIEPSPVELRCVASGTPMPILSWSLNGHTLISTARIHNHLLSMDAQLAAKSSSGNVMFINEHENNASFERHQGRVHQITLNGGRVLVTLALFINSTEKEVSGNYICSAINAVGKDEGFLRINVLGKNIQLVTNIRLKHSFYIQFRHHSHHQH